MKKDTSQKDLIKRFNTPRPLRPTIVVAAAILLVLATAVISSLFQQKSPSSMSSYNYGLLEGSGDFRYAAESANFAASKTSDSGVLAAPVERKIIFSGYLQLEVQSADEAQEFALDYIQDRGGFVADTRRVVGEDDRVQIRMVLRIPAGGFDRAMTDFAALGKILDQNIQGQDITEQYYDLETRLETKKQQEKRYLEILETALTVEEVLKVERELERIRTEIESAEGTLRFYKDRTDLATITLQLNEPEKTGVPGSTFRNIFKEIGEAFLSSLKGLLVFAGYALPWIIVLAVVIVLVSWSRRHRKG